MKGALSTSSSRASPSSSHHHQRSMACRAGARGGVWLAAAAAARRLRHKTSAASAAAASTAASTPSTAAQQTTIANEEGPIWYSDYPLDRAAHLRHDAEQLRALFASPRARLLPVSGGRALVVPREGASGAPAAAAAAAAAAEPSLKLAWVTPATAAAPLLDPAVPPLFLGLDSEGNAHFGGQAARGSSGGGSDGADALAALVPGARWAVARSAGPSLAPGEAAIVATAAGLAQWHLSALRSGATGEETEGAEGGFARMVPSTKRTDYPRIDPAIITLVTAGEWALLGRKPGWAAGRFSTLAGFLEVGETLEQALAREVFEESAVQVDERSIRYVGSQPWPFPRSLMVGFRAECPVADSGSGDGGGASSGYDLLKGPARAAALGVGISPDEVEAALLPRARLPAPVPQPGEMEDVRWFHRDYLLAAVAASGTGSGAGAGSTDGFTVGSSSNSGSINNNNGSSSSNGNGGVSSAMGAGPGAGVDFGEFGIPGPYSLAHRLIAGWLKEGAAAAAARAWAGDAVPTVSIAPGRQKYVLLRLREAAGGGDGSGAAAPKSKLLVWGHPHAEYHNHILQRAKAVARPLGLEVDALGGGRLERRDFDGEGGSEGSGGEDGNANGGGGSGGIGEIAVYGYSAAFGPAPHEIAAALVQRWYPFHELKISYDGY